MSSAKKPIWIYSSDSSEDDNDGPGIVFVDQTKTTAGSGKAAANSNVDYEDDEEEDEPKLFANRPPAAAAAAGGGAAADSALKRGPPDSDDDDGDAASAKQPRTAAQQRRSCGPDPTEVAETAALVAAKGIGHLIKAVAVLHTRDKAVRQAVADHLALDKPKPAEADCTILPDGINVMTYGRTRIRDFNNETLFRYMEREHRKLGSVDQVLWVIDKPDTPLPLNKKGDGVRRSCKHETNPEIQKGNNLVYSFFSAALLGPDGKRVYNAVGMRGDTYGRMQNGCNVLTGGSFCRVFMDNNAHDGRIVDKVT
jgi:hypothetical protein